MTDIGGNITVSVAANSRVGTQICVDNGNTTNSIMTTITAAKNFALCDLTICRRIDHHFLNPAAIGRAINLTISTQNKKIATTLTKNA